MGNGVMVGMSQSKICVSRVEHLLTATTIGMFWHDILPDFIFFVFDCEKT